MPTKRPRSRVDDHIVTVIRDSMREKRMSQKDLAAEAGMSQAQVSARLSTTGPSIPVGQVVRMCAALGIDVGKVLEGAERHAKDPVLIPVSKASSSYDPWEHAARLGIPVSIRRLRRVHGLWLPDYGEIILGEHLKPWAQRCVLAHEIGHAVLGHVDDPPENEWAADRFAGLHLVSPGMLIAAVAKHGPNTAAIGRELGVTSRILTAAFTPIAPYGISAQTSV